MILAAGRGERMRPLTDRLPKVLLEVDGKPLLFDAIEFDPVIATTDILYDLAFPLMDLIHFGQAAAANGLFNRYLETADEASCNALTLFPLFLSMRAAIRAHVLFTKSEQDKDNPSVWNEAKNYFDLAVRLAIAAAAMMGDSKRPKTG